MSIKKSNDITVRSDYQIIVSNVLDTIEETESVVAWLNHKGISNVVRRHKNGFLVCRQATEKERKDKKLSLSIIKDIKAGMLSGAIVKINTQKGKKNLD
jgi:hypothetical protein